MRNASTGHAGIREDAPMTDRDLFLHEFIDIKGMHQWDYMEHTRQQSGDEKVDFELLGTWYTMGITARWPQVVNIWEIPGGWDGWFGKVDRLGLKRASNADAERVVEAGLRIPVRRVRPAARRGAGLPDDRVAGARRRARLAVRPRAHRGAPGHRARLPRRRARGARAAPGRVRTSPRRPVRGDDERLRGVHGVGNRAPRRTCAPPRRATSPAGLARPSDGVDGDARFEEWHARPGRGARDGARSS